MEWQRHQYTSFPWNEKEQKRKKQLLRKEIAYRMLMDCFFYIFGAFSAVMILTYYPLPWG